MKRQVRWVTLTICALLSAGSVAAAITPDDEDAPNIVRPTGVDKRTTKSSRKRSHSTDSATANDISIPASALNPGPSGAVPNTRANSVMVVDARTGAVLHEKNADQPRAAASTQKLLTALIIAETGYLDRPVRVEQIDTLAEPVKLNIRPGDFYQRIDLLRALLVKSPNDVARCLARDNAGSLVIEVRESPVVNRIVLEGNKRLKEDKITPEIRLAPRQIFSRAKARALPILSLVA